MDSTHQPGNGARRSRKKVDSCYSRRTFRDIRHPMIRIGGIYLEKFGFNIGDEIDVSCENGKITIQKVLPDAGAVKSKKTS